MVRNELLADPCWGVDIGKKDGIGAGDENGAVLGMIEGEEGASAGGEGGDR